MKIKIVAVLTFCFTLNAFAQQTITDKNGNKYSEVQNDPTKTRIYTLENGLKVYLSKNTKEPKIQTYVAVRTGSNNDPADNTGLAHYLEHMLFKGNSKLGSLNWEKEKPLLDKIANLYEQHKAEKDPAKKKRIYKQIDSVSVIAAQYVAPNEFNDLMASFGGSEFNAFTFFNETVYESIIPSNELERWSKLESDRFSELVLRLFHTELESVYEEYNGTLGSDGMLMQTAFLKNVFPNSPYSDQTLIGFSEHLKNPSMKAIEQYFKHYYVPNNMAVILVGDLDYDQSIASVKKHFGKLKRAKDPIHKTFSVAPITKPVVSEIVSPSQEYLRFGYRIKGTNSREAQVAHLVNQLLSNGTAGLIDINVRQAQKVLGVFSFISDYKDYRIHGFNVTPRNGQSLDEAKEIILAEIEKIKKGDFDDWLLKAVINQLKIEDQKALENTTTIGTAMRESFIKQQDWKETVFGVEELSKISKQEIVEVANRIYQNNYHIVYKKQGDYPNVVPVEKPSITPLQLSKVHSKYYNDANNTKSQDLQPQFVDFEKEIHRETVKGSPFYHIKNEVNDLAELQYITEYGSAHNKKLQLALGYLSFLSTKDLTVEEIKKQKFTLGVGFYPSVGERRTKIKITGLDKNITDGIKLLENIIQNGVVDEKNLNIFKATLAQSITNAKTDPENMFDRLSDYTMEGKDYLFRNLITPQEIMNISKEDIVSTLKEFFGYEQSIFYYGNNETAVKDALEKYHQFGNIKVRPGLSTIAPVSAEGEVFFLPYDNLQAEVVMGFSQSKFNKEFVPYQLIYNQYFGEGLSSIVFQEIRESRSLAYSAQSSMRSPHHKDDYHYVFNYMGTQSDKLEDAVSEFKKLLQDMPQDQAKFESAKQFVQKQMESTRYSGAGIFSYWLSMKDKGIETDVNKEYYQTLKKMTLADLVKFHTENIKGKKMNFGIMGSKEHIDWKAVEKMGNGKVKEVTVGDIFGY